MKISYEWTSSHKRFWQPKEPKKRKRNMPGNEAYLMVSLALVNGLQIYVASAISNPRGVTEANANETRDHCSFRWFNVLLISMYEKDWKPLLGNRDKGLNRHTQHTRAKVRHGILFNWIDNRHEIDGQNWTGFLWHFKQNDWHEASQRTNDEAFVHFKIGRFESAENWYREIGKQQL